MYALLPHLILPVALLNSAALVRDDDHVEIPVAEVPEAVRKAADKAVPHSRWNNAGRETVEGKVLYDLFGKDERGREVVIELNAGAAVIKIGTKVAEAEVPDTIKRALKRDLPEFRASGFIELSRGGRVKSYCVGGTKGGEAVEALVDVERREAKLLPPDVRL